MVFVLDQMEFAHLIMPENNAFQNHKSLAEVKLQPTGLFPLGAHKRSPV